MDLICPVCGAALCREDKRYCCERRHSYDLAKSGYVNLLPPTPAGKRHGDDKRMVSARTAFLSRGYYDHLQQAVSALACELAGPSPAVVDAGCGEGAYTRRVFDALTADGRRVQIFGIDISTDALRHAARLVPSGVFCAASTAHMPLAGGCASLVLNIFSPCMAEEFRRVLRPDGFLLRVVPMERHLWELKSAIYTRPYENPAPVPGLPGFVLCKQETLRRRIHLATPEDVQNLFQMTPYYYKTGAEDQKKLDGVAQLDVTTEFLLTVYQPCPQGQA